MAINFNGIILIKIYYNLLKFYNIYFINDGIKALIFNKKSLIRVQLKIFKKLNLILIYEIKKCFKIILK